MRWRDRLQGERSEHSSARGKWGGGFSRSYGWACRAAPGKPGARGNRDDRAAGRALFCPTCGKAKMPTSFTNEELGEIWRRIELEQEQEI
ncbi:hypothetical protein CMK17_21650 [Candidatus Poribacteria bacterium]|nr:hypothetical protein [Candidatus Poribacteria bacterium]